MANHKSAKKRIRQTARRLQTSKPVRSHLKSAEKTLKNLLSQGEKHKAEGLKNKLSAFYTLMDQAVRKGIQHKNKAMRKKSQMARLINQHFSKNKEKSPSPPSA